MKTKSFPAQFKSMEPQLIDQDAAIFEAVVSVFDNKDYGGDIVRPGAFTDTIAAWAKSGNTMPVLWSHRMDDPSYNIGSVLVLEEMAGGDPRLPDWANPVVKRNGGLYVKAQLDTRDEETPVAAQVRHLLRKRRVTQFSFAYEVLDSVPGIEEGTTELRKLWLYEVGPTPIGMNPATELLAAKSADELRQEFGLNEPDPAPPDDPVTPEIPSKGGPSAAFFRLRADIAAWAYAHQD